jgi:mono/diheme cytochrome c family protein
MPGVRAPRIGLIGLVTAGVAALIALSGCDLQESADTEQGRMLFITKCGTCHALKEAGTAAEVGPNLDAAFREARASGMDQDTIEGVVTAQVADPRFTSPDDEKTYMPPELVKGEDADDVAAYVASVAGVPGVKPPIPPGAGPGGQVFLSQGCGSCHTLQAASATGTTGPNLDENLPGMSPAEVKNSIIDPDATITKGFQSGVMPDTYEEDISPQDLDDLVKFLLDSAGKSK